MDKKGQSIQLTEIDVKYNRKRIVAKINFKVFFNFTICNDYMCMNCDGLVYIFGKTETIFKNIARYPGPTWIFGKYLLYKNYCRNMLNIIVYDTETHETKNVDYLFYVLNFSPSGSILCRNSRDNDIFDTVEDFTKLKKKTTIEGINSNLDWINDNELIAFYDGYIVRFIVHKNEKVKHNIGRINNCEVFNFYSTEKCTICVSNFRILFINRDNIEIINNDLDIRLYNRYYDLFLDTKEKLYRFVDNRFIKFEYDLLRDSDKPQHVQDIMDVIMMLYLFPIEICNVVYQQLMIETKN